MEQLARDMEKKDNKNMKVEKQKARETEETINASDSEPVDSQGDILSFGSPRGDSEDDSGEDD